MEIGTFLEYQEKESPNTKKIRDFYLAARERNMDVITKLLIDEPVWNVCPGFPFGGIYHGMNQVYGEFYPNLKSSFHHFGAIPDVIVDSGDIVLVLGFYEFIKNESDPRKLVRFAHTWKIDQDGHIKGVWQVADSAQFIEYQADAALVAK